MKKSKMWVCRVGIVLLGLLAAVVFAQDTDTDGMSDGYELFFGLNHTNASDALLDTDGDSVTNLTESILWTDPLFADTDRDGWPDSIDANPLSRAVFLWSNPKFATGDSYLYTGPLWWNNAFRVGGDWTTNGWEAGNGLSNNTGSLNIQVLRSLLTNDVVLDVELFDATNASLYAALCDSNQAVIVNDLYGNIVTGSQEVVTRRLSIPFSSYSNASILRLWRGTGDITVYSSLMYIDEDGDGVDADQELQAGTSDNDADSDDDGLNDFAELFLTDTDPLDADSDDDGYDDQAEVTAESDPNDDQSLPQYAVCFTLPFTETFEERSAGDLDGQHGWEVNDGGVAIVQSNIVFGGEQALSVTDASVSHEFTDAQTNVWVSYRLKAVPGSEPQDLPADMAVVFYVNADSLLCAYSNQTPITLPVTVSNDWNRFDIHSDFSSKRWNMRFNRELVVDNFPFYGSPDAFSILRVDGTGTYMDDVQVVFENPDRDNDGYTNDEEAEEGSDPDDSQSLPDDVLIELEQTSLLIPEGGAAQLGVRLSAAPGNASPVLVTLVSGDSDITVQEGVSLVFTTNNWMIVQYVSLSAAQDADWLDGTAVVRCHSTGRESIEIQVTEEDDEFDPDYSTPWTEPFEELTAGNLNDQRGWAVSGEGTALVQSNTVFAGNQAAAITDASASHEFEDGQPNVWVSYRLKAVPGNGPENIPDDMAVVFWVNSDSYLCVYSNQTAVTLPVKVSEDWNRFEFYCDFSSKHWNLRLNRELVVNDFPFYGSPTAFSLIRLDGNGDGTFMDDVQVVLENPDRDNDGYTNDEETEGGSDPDDANSIPVSEVTVSGVVHYDGSQTGTVHVIATTVSNGWNSAANDQLDVPGAYSISNVPVLSSVWIKAWLDSDANGICDPWEAKCSIESPLYLSFPKSGVNLTLIVPDEDGDGLDAEQEHDLGTSDEDADSDDDGLTDWEEVVQTLTDPLDSDSDDDGLSDGAEVQTHGTNPLSSDSDDDELTDSEEVALLTDPLNPDTDGDGLGDKMESGPRSYQIVYEFMRWSEAKAHAEALGGRLAVIDSEAKQQEVERFVALDSSFGRYPWGFSLFVGATDQDREENWKWITGEALSYTHWADDYPTINPVEPYAAIRAKSPYGWIDVGVTEYHPALVEFETNQLDPNNPDSDGDGVSDGEEFAKGMNPCSLDSDGDGLSDAYETSLGLNGGVMDTDSDGLSDSVEISLGTDPLSFDSDGDSLIDGEEINITLSDPLTASSVSVVSSIPGVQTTSRFRSHEMVKYIEDGNDLIIKSLIDWPTVTYSLNITTANMYRLSLQLAPEGDVRFDYLRYPIEVRINGLLVGETLAVINRGSSSEGFVYTPWLEAGTYEVELRFGRFARSTRNIRLHALELITVEGADADGNGIADWIDARMGVDVDTDGDGLSDYDEINTYGTDALKADSDNDGLNDGEEITLGTDPLDADSDDDGVNDGDEADGLGTNPLNPEFDGMVTNLLTLNGSETNRTTGEWHVEGSAIHSESRRGELDYLFTLPTQDVVRLEIEAAHLWNSSYSSQSEDASELDFYVDGIYIGTRELVSVDGTFTNVQIFLPVLSDGEHTLTVFWENLHRRLVLKVNELRFQQLGGPDADGDGTKDWVQASLASMTSVDAGLESFVSPACIEGAARYPELARISNIEQGVLNAGVQQGAGERWFVNTPLNEDGVTDVAVSFQNGAFERTVQAEWVPYNLIEHNGETLVVCKGTQVKLVALPDDANGGQFELEFLVTAEGETVRSPNTRPLIYSFPEAGIYTVSGAYTHGNDTEMASIQVRVVDWEFSGESPACLDGRQREWTVDLPEGATVETDNTIEMGVLDISPTTNNQQRTTLFLKAKVSSGDHTMVTRLYADGPIISSIPLKLFWMQSNVDHYMTVVERYEDSELWETTTVAKHLPESVDVFIDVFAGGVTLDDYTIERWLTNEDFEANGEYTFRLFHPNDRDGSTCYVMDVHQDDQQIGEIR